MYFRSQNDSQVFRAPASPPPAITLPTLTLGDAAQLERLFWIVSLSAWLTYAVYFAQLTSFPFQDYPNHLARAAILADLLFNGGHRFGTTY